MSLQAKVLIVALVMVGYAFWRLSAETNNNVGYAPVQPLAFSHKIHSGQNKIPCLYCHTNAERSPHATVPSMNICMGCHNVVATNKPEIMKLRQAYTDKRSVEWIRIHSVPDFVYFNHSAHIAKGVACQTCHGPVETMERVYQVRRLNMGDCVTCHRQNKASISCNTCHN